MRGEVSPQRRYLPCGQIRAAPLISGFTRLHQRSLPELENLDVRNSIKRQKQKALTKTRPHPRPLSHGERGACFIKNKKPSPRPTKSPGQTRNAKPHHLMKCARMGAFRGAWGDFVPPQKKDAWGDWSPHKKKSPQRALRAGSHPICGRV